MFSDQPPEHDPYVVSHKAADDIAEQERLKGYELYYGASRPSQLATEQLRGRAMEEAAGGLGVGGLAARGAQQAIGRGSYAAGVEGTRMGSQDRLQASNMAIGAASHQAQYEQGLQQAYLDLLRSYEQAAQQQAATKQYKKEQERAMSQNLVGSALGAGGAVAAAAGGMAQQQQYYGSAGNTQPTAQKSGEVFGQEAYGRVKEQSYNPYLDEAYRRGATEDWSTYGF